MSLHSAVWRVHCSAVDDIALIESALAWLAGDGVELTREKSKSYHGAPQLILEASITKKRDARDAFVRLGKQTLEELLHNGISSHIDENKILHLRIDIDDLVQGRVRMARGVERKMAAKGRFKIESYPGEKPETVIVNLIKECLES